MFVIGEDDDLYLGTAPSRAPGSRTRTPRRRSTTPPARPRGPKGVQITHRNIWTNAVTFALHAGVTDRDVYLHTLPMFHANGWGMPFAMTGCGVPQVVLRKVDGAEILRRVEKYGVTVMCAAPAVVAAVLDAAPGWDGEIPGRWPDPDHRRGCAAADQDGGPGRGRARLGVPPDLRADRDFAAAHLQPRASSEWDDLTTDERAQKLVRAGTPGDRSDSRGGRRGRGVGPLERRARGLLGAARGDREGAGRAAGSTPATAGSSTTRATSPSRTGRRT